MAKRVPRQLALLQALGFLLVVLLIWADELFDVPHAIFGAPATIARLPEAILESSVIVVLGGLVILATARLVQRLIYLESFVVLCGWCRRVYDDEHWVSFEAFLGSHKVKPSHGLCPDCEARLNSEIDRGTSPTR